MIPVKRQLVAALAVLAASGAMAAGAPSAGPTSGIDMSNGDTAIRAQDDFYQYVNGGWLKKAEIPADKARWGSFDELRENVLPQLRALIDTASTAPNRTTGSDQQKIGDLYASFMDQSRRDTLGRAPLVPEFARIAALQDKKQLPALMAYFSRIGVSSPFEMGVSQDGRDAAKYAVIMAQGGLGLPDRDYYLKDDDAKLKDARNKYQALIEASLAQGGEANAAASARDIVALETALAKVQWTKVENRNPVKSYNKLGLTQFEQLAPGFDWKSYQDATGISAAVNYVIVRQPSYFTGFAKIMQDTPLAVWQAYYRWHVLNRFAPYLGTADVEREFAFYGGTLRGVPVNEPGWKRGVRLVEGGTGEILGKLYVEKYFPPENKARMEKLVANLLVAYKQSIDTLDWMSPATKKEAQAKLATFAPKIGYPSKWRDYTKLSIDKGDLVGNVQRVSTFNYERQMAKLGKPIDREEWGMTPQTVNAYYNPQKNEIVFPAAILQPPFFDAKADDAVNYGGIGAVIGHEISHGFDDQGSQFDEVGNLRDWWTKEDHEKFAVKTKALVAQYDRFSPVPGYFVSGALTLGENIADNSGLAIAYKAYQLSLNGKPAPTIDGLTGDQRLYLGWAQVWRGKAREAQSIVLIKTDPHSPSQFRGNGTLKNQPGFYSAYGIKEGDQMYLKPEERVLIW
ncbi:MAG: M13 family peptidase [Herminiimonas sp.]|nr:M13 family peptidase [Herminiimonas sp.]